MKNEEKLKLWDLENKVRYYRLKFPFTEYTSKMGVQNYKIRFGIATICLLPYTLGSPLPKQYYVRGIAFCNPKDQLNKKVGRAIALGRAIQAISNHYNNEPIKKTTPVFILAQEYGWCWLSQWDVRLTDFEKKLLKIELS